MKKMKIGLVLVIAAIAVSALLLGSCDLFSGSVTMYGRIDAFRNDLNAGNYSNIYTHFHPDTANRDQIKDAAVFTSGPLSSANAPFQFTDRATSGETVTASFSNANGDDIGTATFKMRLSGADYYIREFTLSVGGTDYTIKRLIPLTQ